MTLTVFEILLFKGWSVLRPVQRVSGSERANIINTLKRSIFFDNSVN